MTLGYKGRLLIHLTARQPMAHTAGPDTGVATVAVDLWNQLAAQATAFNAGKDRVFDQLMPSLRAVQTFSDDAMNDCVTALAGIRLPLAFDPADLAADLSPNGRLHGQAVNRWRFCRMFAIRAVHSTSSAMQ